MYRRDYRSYLFLSFCSEGQARSFSRRRRGDGVKSERGVSRGSGLRGWTRGIARATVGYGIKDGGTFSIVSPPANSFSFALPLLYPSLSPLLFRRLPSYRGCRRRSRKMGWAIQCHRQDGSRFLQNVGISLYERMDTVKMKEMKSKKKRKRIFLFPPSWETVIIFG